jgi:hypothetical protein
MVASAISKNPLLRIQQFVIKDLEVLIKMDFFSHHSDFVNTVAVNPLIKKEDWIIIL